MKSTKVLIAIAAGLVVFGLGCRKDNLDKLNQSDQEALVGIEAAYDNAQVYNDSLIYCAGSGHSCSQEYIEYCDSMFHHYEDLWNHHHDDYSHDNPHDDHHHDSHGMQHHGNHNNHDDSEGHHETQHNQMEHLSDEHEPYHP